jgi:DNA end-binding protein Ku
MAPRSFRSYLKLSLVTCPVAVFPASSESEKVRFHTLNHKAGNGIVGQYVDAVSGRPMDEDNEAKGYPRDESDYGLLEDDELEAVAPESTRTIDIEKFVPADSLAPMRIASGSDRESRLCYTIDLVRRERLFRDAHS